MKSKAIAFPYVGWMALFVVAPLVIITVYAFTGNSGGFTLDNFASMTQYASAFARSFLLAAIATVVCVLIGYPLAYFLARETGWVHRMATMLIRPNSTRLRTCKSACFFCPARAMRALLTSTSTA